MPHMRIRPVEFHVVGIVLHAFQHAVAIGVPTARDPTELQGLADARPDALAARRGRRRASSRDRRARSAPSARRRRRSRLRALPSGKHGAEVDGALVVHAVAEGRFPQRARKGGEQVRRDGLVVPDVRAVAEAAAAMIAGAFEAAKLAIGGAETGGRGQRGEIGGSGVLQRGRDGAFAQRGGELAGLAFQRFRDSARHTKRPPRHPRNAWRTSCR